MGDPITKVVVFTDCIDIAYNEIYQSLQRELSLQGIHSIPIDPLVPIKPFSIVNAAFSLRLLAGHYSKGTLFLVILNATSSSPERIFGQTEHGLYFVGNNSGYFNWLFKDFGVKEIYENHINREVNGKPFGGKYVQVPTAAKLMANTPLSEIGIKKDSSFLSSYTIKEGAVVHCDNFGLMKIKGEIPEDFQESEKLQISVNGNPKVEAVFSKSMKRCTDGAWVLYRGSSLDGLPELGKVRCSNSALELKVCEGDIITWQRL